MANAESKQTRRWSRRMRTARPRGSKADARERNGEKEAENGRGRETAEVSRGESRASKTDANAAVGEPMRRASPDEAVEVVVEMNAAGKGRVENAAVGGGERAIRDRAMELRLPGSGSARRRAVAAPCTEAPTPSPRSPRTTAEGTRGAPRGPRPRGPAGQATFRRRRVPRRADQFRSRVLGISERRPLSSTDQARVMPRLAWEAIERAGLAGRHPRGQRTPACSSAHVQRLRRARFEPSPRRASTATWSSSKRRHASIRRNRIHARARGFRRSASIPR